MLAPLSWLKEYVDIDVTPKELEEKLFSCGFEVEELTELGKDISGVVVARVVDKHFAVDLLDSLHVQLIDNFVHDVEILLEVDRTQSGVAHTHHNEVAAQSVAMNLAVEVDRSLECIVSAQHLKCCR